MEENKIIDVEYREVTDLEELSTETLAEQANTIYKQAEAVAAVSLQLVAEAGKRLNVIKERIGHGNWEAWAGKNLEFSKSKAEKMMKLAKKTEDTKSLFSKTETFTDIGISKVWALLSAPEEVAAEVVENPETESMTVRELKEEIQRIKKENETLEQEKAALHEMRSKVWEQASRIKELEAEIENAEPSENLERQLQDLKEKHDKTKAELREYKKTVKEQAEQARTRAEEEAKKKAEAETKKKIEEQAEQIRREEAVKRETLENEIAKLTKMSDPAVMEFKIRADALQEEFAACRKAIQSAGEERQEKMKTALKVVLRRMEDQI